MMPLTVVEFADHARLGEEQPGRRGDQQVDLTDMPLIREGGTASTLPRQWFLSGELQPCSLGGDARGVDGEDEIPAGWGQSVFGR